MTPYEGRVRLASTLICQELAAAAEHGANRGATADRIIESLTRSMLIDLRYPMPEASTPGDPSAFTAAPNADLVHHIGELRKDVAFLARATTPSAQVYREHLAEIERKGEGW